MAKSLLIVEDDRDMAEAMRAALVGAGYDVTCAFSGRGALDALSKRPFLADLVLVDCKLPDMSGFELLDRKARWERDRQLGPVPALLVSGDDAALEARPPAVVGVLGKPFEPAELLGAVRVALDARAEHGEDLARELAHSQRKLRAREDLLAMVCHDLRIPLTTVSMTIASLLSDAKPDERLADRAPELERVLRAARQMRRLTRDLLDFSQLESGKLRVVLSRQPLGEVVAHAVEAASAAFPGRVIRAVVDPDARAAAARCDRGRLLQVLGNLIGNACQYTPEGGAVTVRLRREPGAVALAVEDEGPGIAEADLPHLFDAYRRGRERGPSEEGLGLGLFIARGIVEAHGGSLAAEPRRGGGTVMTVRLPCEAGELDVPTILVVDDDEDLRTELCDVLESEGYRVLPAADGGAAWDLLHDQPMPALALLDLMMPVMNGWELLAHIKHEPELARLPAVIISSLEAQRVEPSLFDVAGYLEKPIKLSQLMKMVRRYAGRPARSTP